MKPFQFEILHTSTLSRARVGRIYTPHGIIDTPGFVAVGTNGTIKALDNTLLASLGLQLMFCNTYHLLLQPGAEVVKEAGGLHSFIRYPGPLITDSGGFQIFSLAFGSVHEELKSAGQKKGNTSVLKITEEGVIFRSYRDGSKILLTPESSIAIQKDLGADIIIPLDELPPYHTEKEELIKSLERTHRWEIRSLETHLANPKQQAIYGVIHGGIDPHLRKKSCDILTPLPFDGFAIGGSVGKNKQELFDLMAYTRPLLPDEKPTHLLGIGDLTSLIHLIPLGIDTFDSSYPTKAARHGFLFTDSGGIRIKQSLYKKAFRPIENNCACFTCQHYTLSYLHHLFKAKETTFQILSTLHNLHYMVRLMETTRQLIFENKL